MPRPSKPIRGVVRQRASGRWQAVITLPYDAEQDKYPQISRSFDTEREAEIWKLEQTDPRRRPVVQRGMTVAQLLDKWLDHQHDRIAATTHDTYRRYANNRIKPTIGDVALDRLSVDDVDDLYALLRRQGLAPASVRQVHAIVRSALTWGRKRRYVDMNVALDADPPSVKTKRTTPPTPSEVRTLLAAACELDYEFGVACRLAAATGARRGTVAAFRQSDFGFSTNTVLIDRSVSVVDGVRHVKGLKYEDTGGTIPVDERTMTIAADHIAWLHDRARKCGFSLADDFYLFAQDVACTIPRNPYWLTHLWQTCRRNAGLKTVRFHDLRHFVPTELLAAGFDGAVITDRLKWASMAMLDVYGHATSEQSRAAGDHIGRSLG